MSLVSFSMNKGSKVNACFEWILDENNEMIGCCVLTARGNGVVQLRQMAVKGDYRGKGIGASIVDFAEGVARENGFTTLMMHARDPVVGFYEKSGYETYGEPFSELGIGHHKMRKQLY